MPFPAPGRCGGAAGREEAPNGAELCAVPITARVTRLGVWHCTGNPAWAGMNETWLLQQDDILGVKETTPTQAGVSE